MDKFGIFNLLSTALGSFNKKEENAEQNLPAVLDAEAPTSTPLPPKTPLQAQMISTIKEHENFVKRVYQKQLNNK